MTIHPCIIGMVLWLVIGLTLGMPVGMILRGARRNAVVSTESVVQVNDLHVRLRFEESLENGDVAYTDALLSPEEAEWLAVQLNVGAGRVRTRREEGA